MDRLDFTLVDNADESFYLEAEFAAGEAPLPASITEIEMDVRATADAAEPLATLKLSTGEIVLASTHAADTIGFRITFGDGDLAPGYNYVADIIATVAGNRRNWFAARVRVDQGVTRDD